MDDAYMQYGKRIKDEERGGGGVELRKENC